MTDRTRRTPKTRDWRPAFLTAFADGLTVTAACQAAGVGRTTVYDERQRNESFASGWDDIEERTTENMEREAYRRAVDGWAERKIFDDKGREIGEVQKYSDTLLIFMLKARRPGTYRENYRHELVGAGGGPVAVEFELDAGSREAIAGVLRGRPAAGSE